MQICKVMISCPMNIRKNYCLEDYLQNISQLTYPKKEYYLSDNSFDKSFHLEELLLKGWNCGYVSPHNKDSNQYITESFNQIREYFLQSDAEYLFLCESDLFPPTDIIEQLICYQKPVVSCHYFIGEGKESKLLHQQFDDKWLPDNVNINSHPSQSFMEFGTDKWSSNNSGLGVILLRRDVLEQIQFSCNDRTNHCDTFFSRDLDYLGIEVTYSGILVEHRNRSWQSYSDFKK